MKVSSSSQIKSLLLLGVRTADKPLWSCKRRLLDVANRKAVELLEDTTAAAEDLYGHVVPRMDTDATEALDTRSGATMVNVFLNMMTSHLSF